MKSKNIIDALGGIDYDMIDDAEGEHKNSKKTVYIKWGALAACLLLIAVVAVPFLINNLSIIGNDPSDKTNIVSLGSLERPYKDIDIYSQERAIIWPWEYLTTAEKYGTMIFDGNEYQSRHRMIDPSLLGDVLGDCTATAYEERFDTNTVVTHEENFEVRRLKNVSEELIVAVKIDGEYYVFMDSDIRNEYNPPATFGELMESFALHQTLPLSRFSVCEGYDTKGYYTIENDDYIWEILSDSANAKVSGDDIWLEDINYISFTATSEALGIYKKVFYVTEDGYVWTNTFEYGYKYCIGEDAAEKIIDYATENAKPAQYEPYEYYLSGTISEIGDDYVLIDDSIRCVDPDNGMIFKVITDELRIKRCVELLGIKEGDFVRVAFDGKIDVEAGNVIKGASSIDEAFLRDGDVLVEE